MLYNNPMMASKGKVEKIEKKSGSCFGPGNRECQEELKGFS